MLQTPLYRQSLPHNCKKLEITDSVTADGLVLLPPSYCSIHLFVFQYFASPQVTCYCLPGRAKRSQSGLNQH